MENSRKAPITYAIALLGAAVLVTGCEGGGPPGAEEARGSGPGAVGPPANPDGTRPGLAPVADADRAAARKLIGSLATKGRGPGTGYEREKFGRAWSDTADGVPLARNGCDTRNDVLRRDGRELRFRDGSDCVVVAMTLSDPYTGKDIVWKKAKAAEVQIDHVVPLAYGWRMGAARWTADQRERFANDALNLLAVDGPANQAKRDSGPASWLPPNKAVRCAYAMRFAQVARKYELLVTAPDRNMMLKQCGS
ncbi:HNH endonuclease family protein [Streptomyces sp. NPDC094448]|uniref:HNH endonuclease family protein n=1 Tax=Streptomyces sp. NPDC094448 TaxID=3366063 RepID=UPI0038075AE3